MSRDVFSTFIGPDDPRWVYFLENTRHDFYHLPSYARTMSKYEGGTPVAFYAERGHCSFLLPLLIRAIPESLGASQAWSDAASPYGYPGPLMHNVGDRATVDLFVKAFRTCALKHDIVTVFVRLHPLLNDTPEIFRQLGSVVRHGETVHVDLSKSAEEIWRQLRRDYRKCIRQIRCLGFTVEFDSWNKLHGFIDAYQATMERVSAPSFYRFPESYFHELREALASRLHLCTVHAPDGEIASGSLFTLINGIAQYHLAGTHKRYLPIAPSKLMTYSQMMWLKAAGAAVFHLGGGVSSRADSLLHFKAGFSKLRSSFWTCSAIIDKSRYHKLVADTSDNIALDEEFFPAYRQARHDCTLKAGPN